MVSSGNPTFRSYRTPFAPSVPDSPCLHHPPTLRTTSRECYSALLALLCSLERVQLHLSLSLPPFLRPTSLFLHSLDSAASRLLVSFSTSSSPVYPRPDLRSLHHRAILLLLLLPLLLPSPRPVTRTTWRY